MNDDAYLYPPWTKGTNEIWEHAHSLCMSHDSKHSELRIAFICTDNAVELMLKTYLSLPDRVKGFHLSRRELDEASRTFPGLVEKLDEVAKAHSLSILDGIDLGEIEWFHIQRNQLYHQGAVMSVDRSLVTKYLILASELSLKLFGVGLMERHEDSGALILSSIVSIWVQIETFIVQMLASEGLHTPPGTQAIDALKGYSLIDEALHKELLFLQDVRHRLMFDQDSIRADAPLLSRYQSAHKALERLKPDTTSLPKTPSERGGPSMERWPGPSGQDFPPQK